MPLYHFFTDTQRTPPRLGVSRSNPPITGGTVVDSFQHEDASTDELRRMAEQRNSPLYIEWREGAAWQRRGEEYRATPIGLEGARQAALEIAGATGSARVVTCRGKVVWEAGGATAK